MNAASDTPAHRDASPSPAARPRVVIVGAGFGGLFAAKAMKRLDADVTLVDRHNHHLFQPLLYQVATAGLAPSDIAWPVRSVLARQRNLSVRFGTVGDVDTAAREVVLDDARLPYDHLVCATGARHSYFGREDWARRASRARPPSGRPASPPPPSGGGWTRPSIASGACRCGEI